MRGAAPPGSCGHSGPAALRFESGNLDMLRRLVDHSGGLTLLPERAAAELGEGARSRVRPFADPAPLREIRLVRGRAFLRRRAIEALAGEIRALVEGE